MFPTVIAMVTPPYLPLVSRTYTYNMGLCVFWFCLLQILRSLGASRYRPDIPRVRSRRAGTALP